jgi:hypothetical protein
MDPFIKAPEKPKPKKSELRQRFEKYCKEKPWAPECKIYES